MQKILNNWLSRVIFGIVLMCGVMANSNVRGADQGEGEEEFEPGAVSHEGARLEQLSKELAALRIELAYQKKRAQKSETSLAEQITLVCQGQRQYEQLQARYDVQSRDFGNIQLANGSLQLANDSLRKSLQEATATREDGFKYLRAAQEESRKLSEENQKLKQESSEAHERLVSKKAAYDNLERAYNKSIVDRNTAQIDAQEVPLLRERLLKAGREGDPLRAEANRLGAEVKRLIEERDSLRAEVKRLGAREKHLESCIDRSLMIRAVGESLSEARAQAMPLPEPAVSAPPSLRRRNSMQRNNNKRWSPAAQKIVAVIGIAGGLGMAAFCYRMTQAEAENNNRPVTIKK